MTVSDIYMTIANGGMRTAAAVIAIPLLIGGIALLLRGGNPRASQAVANFGIVIGLVAVSMEILALLYAVQELGVDPLTDVNLILMLAPVYLLGAGFLVEHLLHPGSQENLRARLRSVVLIVIVLAVLYYLISKLRLYMVIWTSIVGFILFVGFLVAVLYYVVRKVL